MSELAKAILAAAEKDFSTFSGIVGDTAEEKFASALNDRVGEESEKVFEGKYSPEYKEALTMHADVLRHRKNGDEKSEKDSLDKLQAHVKKHSLNRHLNHPGTVSTELIPGYPKS